MITRAILLAASAAVGGFALLTPDGTSAPSVATVNYAQHVAPILDAHCVQCHRPGEVAPFSLIGYDNAKKWAKMAAQVTGTHQMPPWKPVPGYGSFMDENRLTPAEVETLKRWVQANERRGDPQLDPPTPKFAGEWPLGQPDLILEPEKEFKIAPEGDDIYRNFVMKNDFDHTVWVTAMAIKPGNPRVVHHVIAFLDNSGNAQKLEAQESDGQPGYDCFGGPGFIPSGSLGGWAPGLQTHATPDGTAFKVAAGTKIVLQIHYHRSGKAETDKTRVGLYFSKVPVTKEMNLRWMLNPILMLRPGEKAQKVTLTNVFRRGATIYSVLPHMHLLGKSMKAWVELPDGTTKPLIFIDHWDFNWQMAYMLKQPMHVPAGSKVQVEAIYDNSSDNPNNPSNPPKLVTFGEQTTDEMMLLVVAFTVDEP